MDIEDLERNDLAGSLAYYESIRDELLAAETWQRSALLSPLLRLHDDPRVLSRAIRARFPRD